MGDFSIKATVRLWACVLALVGSFSGAFQDVRVFAHGDHSELSQAALEGLSLEDKEFYEKASRFHHELEELLGTDRHGLLAFLITWAQALNPQNYVSNIMRSYHRGSNRDAREIWHDILFLFLISHPIEMASGPILTMIGLQQGWDLHHVLGAGTVGLIISVPGLDPLCILLAGTFLLPPKIDLLKALKLHKMFPDRSLVISWSPVHRWTIVPYRKLVRMSRSVVIGTPLKWLDRSGGLSLLEKFFPATERLEHWYLNANIPDDYSVQIDADGEIFSQSSQFHIFLLSEASGSEEAESQVRLHLSIARTLEGDWYLKEIWLPNDLTASDRAAIKTLVQTWNYNSRKAVHEVLRLSDKGRLHRYAERFFVHDHGSDVTGQWIEFEAGSIHLSKKRQPEPASGLRTSLEKLAQICRGS